MGGQIVDASLVAQVDIDGRSSFSLLAIVREYALGRLKARGEAGAVRAAHADYYIGLVRRVAPGVPPVRRSPRCWPPSS